MVQDLNTLIRLNEWTVDERRRELGDVLSSLAELESGLHRLRDELASRRGELLGSTPCHRFMRRLNRARALTVDRDRGAARETYTRALSHLEEPPSELRIDPIHYAELILGHSLLLADQTEDPMAAQTAFAEIELVGVDRVSVFVRSVLDEARKLMTGSNVLGGRGSRAAGEP